jgi:hypothetical protein
MAADSVKGEMAPFILTIAHCNCIYSVKSATLLLEYPFTHIASVTFTFVSGFVWHAIKKHAAFLARRFD